MVEWSPRTLTILPPRVPSASTHPQPQYGQTVFTSSVGGSVSFRGQSAPTGQISTHAPQDSHVDSAIDWLPKGATTLANPRFRISIGPTPRISWQTRTHMPQSTHFPRSRTKNGLLSSSRLSFSGRFTLSSATPTCE